MQNAIFPLQFLRQIKASFHILLYSIFNVAIEKKTTFESFERKYFALKNVIIFSYVASVVRDKSANIWIFTKKAKKKQN